MKKVRLSRELIYFLAIIIMTLGVTLMEKANFGVSMVVAPAYIISLRSDLLSFGQSEYCVQLFLVILMCVIVRKFKLSYFFAFVTAIIYGGVLDGMIFLFRNVPAEIMAVRIIFCVLGALLSALGVALFFRTYLSPCAYDQFVKVVATEYHLNMSHFKIGYDITSLLISIVLSYSFFGKFKGIGAATVICAFFNGYIIGKFGEFLDKHFTFYDRLKLAKYF